MSQPEFKLSLKVQHVSYNKPHTKKKTIYFVVVARRFMYLRENPLGNKTKAFTKTRYQNI